MYVPEAFKEERTDVLHGLIRAFPFATLVVAGTAGLDAAHIPVLLDPSRGPLGVLSGHVARPNEIWRAMEGGGEALAIFHGPHAYISPTWSETKVAVPTWNYAVVHVHGVTRLMDDAALDRHLVELVQAFEGRVERPWSLEALDPVVTEKLKKGIVGFEIEIGRIEGKWKMGQNRTAADRAGAIAGLRATELAGSVEVAEWMEQVGGEVG